MYLPNLFCHNADKYVQRQQLYMANILNISRMTNLFIMIKPKDGEIYSF